MYGDVIGESHGDDQLATRERSSENLAFYLDSSVRNNKDFISPLLQLDSLDSNFSLATVRVNFNLCLRKLTSDTAAAIRTEGTKEQSFRTSGSGFSAA